MGERGPSKRRIRSRGWGTHCNLHEILRTNVQSFVIVSPNNSFQVYRESNYALTLTFKKRCSLFLYNILYMLP